MKKLILSTIIISLLSITSILADNNTTSTTNNTNKETVTATANTSNTVVVTITDMSGKTVYTETFTLDTENGANIKLNPSSKLAKGMYVVTVVTGNEKMTDKLIVK
jgi:hypothetical protein